MRKVLVLVAAAWLLAVVPCAWGDVQIFSTSGQDVYLNRDSGLAGFLTPGFVLGGTVLITPVGAWAAESETGVSGSKWISFTDTGSGGGSPSNKSDDPLATFYSDTFTLLVRHQGYLKVWADDTTAVRIIPPGTELFPPSIPSGAACAASPIGCIGGVGGTGASIFLDLAPGTYTLAFDAYQIAGDGFGVLYGANLAPVPEPASVLLFGTVILGVATLIRRKR